MIIFALSALQTLNPTQNFRHRADKILRNIGIFSALLIQAARQRHIAHDGNAFLFSGADHALRQRALSLGQNDGQGSSFLFIIKASSSRSSSWLPWSWKLWNCWKDKG